MRGSRGSRRLSFFRSRETLCCDDVVPRTSSTIIVDPFFHKRSIQVNQANSSKVSNCLCYKLTVITMMKLRFCLLVAITSCLAARRVAAQGCTNTCPPINYGVAVPSLCEGDEVASAASAGNNILTKNYTVCNQAAQLNLEQFRGRVVVLSNFYIGCNAGRRESGVFAHVAQKYVDRYGVDSIVFVASLKGGPTCGQWADIYQSDAVTLFPDSGVVPTNMPLAILDGEYKLRDDFFTTPFGHPSYIVLDGDFTVRHKFIGPCCGYESYYDCTADIAKSLDTTMSEYLDILLEEAGATPLATNEDNAQEEPTTTADPEQPQDSTTITEAPEAAPPATEQDCLYTDFSEWSECSVTCGAAAGLQFRWRIVRPSNTATTTTCEGAPIETRSCQAETAACADQDTGCVPEFGAAHEIQTVASGFHGARDVAFHPLPGRHLGNYSEGRTFHPNAGEEAWVLNGRNHSFSIVASLGDAQGRQTTISRRDRGYYHYMINATALAFNMVGDSNRPADRDSFGYWAVCNDNMNTYLDTKEANNFMGPTLYDSDPKNRNLVNRLGQECGIDEECYLLHADMLHESPGCIGIAHDPETTTAYGNVYWAFDSTGNQQNGQLVRFDFQQPHGPGSMDHSVAAVRRFPDVQLTRGAPGVHAGMVVHPITRELFIAVPGADKVLVVNADSGAYARTAREEYPIFSNRLPSFEYSIWECPEQRDFATDVDTPSGLALSADGAKLFVAERASGDILVFEVGSGSLLARIETEFQTINGLAVSPSTGQLYFVDEETNTLNSVVPVSECVAPFQSRSSASFQSTLASAMQEVANTEGATPLSLMRDYRCEVDVIIPDTSFFDQVHVDTGYASDNPDVQSMMAGMDETAALLANRTDCGYDSDLNFDALLLGGYFCHQCLPDNNGAMCDAGGTCTNVQWLGYVCDNEFIVLRDDTGLIIENTQGEIREPFEIVLDPQVTYRFTVRGESLTLCVETADEIAAEKCASRGPLFVNAGLGEMVRLRDQDGNSLELQTGAMSKDSETTSDVGGASDSSDGPNTGLIAGVTIAAAFVVAVALIFLLRKHSTSTGEKQSVNSSAIENSSQGSHDPTP